MALRYNPSPWGGSISAGMLVDLPFLPSLFYPKISGSISSGIPGSVCPGIGGSI